MAAQSATLTGTATLTSANPLYRGPFVQNVVLDVLIDTVAGTITLSNFLTFATTATLGKNSATINVSPGQPIASGTFDVSPPSSSVPVTLNFASTLSEVGGWQTIYPLSTATPPGSPITSAGAITLAGSGAATNFTGTSDFITLLRDGLVSTRSTLVISGVIAPVPTGAVSTGAVSTGAVTKANVAESSRAFVGAPSIFGTTPVGIPNVFGNTPVVAPNVLDTTPVGIPNVFGTPPMGAANGGGTTPGASTSGGQAAPGGWAGGGGATPGGAGGGTTPAVPTADVAKKSYRAKTF